MSLNRTKPDPMNSVLLLGQTTYDIMKPESDRVREVFGKWNFKTPQKQQMHSLQHVLILS